MQLRISSLAPFLTLLVPVSTQATEPTLSQRALSLLEQRCISCHHGEKPKGELDLTTREGILRGGEIGSTLVPGKPGESLLLDYISGEEPEMPKNDQPLTEAEVQLLRDWISDGANWPDNLTLDPNKALWWSFRPIAQPIIPDVSGDWVRTPIDAFILAKLQEKGLTPSPEADRRTLIRRATFDLHGLPPTPEEIEAFVNDPDPHAWEKLVDRLLASPRYGERWARHWLDVVHYGDTHGFDKDKRRPNAWPYRDYVIRSFNEDTPYSVFVQEQLAGDVLYPDNWESVPATGFIVAGPWDFVGHVELREGTVDKQITRILDRDDMVSNTMSTFTSLTVHCARCHDHKFDPISQEDYYSLQRVFAAVDRADQPYEADPNVSHRRIQLTKRMTELEQQIAGVHQEIHNLAGEDLKALDDQITTKQKQLTELLTSSTERSPTLGYHSSIMNSPKLTKWVQIDLGKSVPIEQVVLIPSHVKYGGHPGPGFGFPVRFRIEISDQEQFEGTPRILADETRRDFPHPGDEPVVINGTGAAGRYVRITATHLWKRTEDWIFALSEVMVLSEGENLAAGKPVTSLDSIENASWNRKALVDGCSSLHRLPLVSQTEGTKSLAVTSQELVKLRSQREELLSNLIPPNLASRLATLQSEMLEARQTLSQLPGKGRVYAAAMEFTPQGNFTSTRGTARPVHLLNRGDVKQPGELMLPGTVSFLNHLPSRFETSQAASEAEYRANLARWIVHPENPLTWRSIVNRVWHYHFGQGLVSTPNDFGRMGSLPTHPELLDYLAVEFRDGNQSLKSLHRLILHSSTYRQSSEWNERNAVIDGNNQYLWRMQRRRLEAEEIRDAVLTLSGTLNPQMYGPGFDLFAFQDDHSPHYYYDRHNPDDPDSLRRSIYRFIVRSAPDPFMETLDCADPSALVPERNTTITALQSLALLNNPFMVRQAEHFADDLRAETLLPRQQVILAWRRAFGRPPSENELPLLVQHVEEHGLESFCRLVFNLNEFVFID